jgi:FkbM family methyltransferase
MKRLINGFLHLFSKEVRSTNAPLHTFERGLTELKRRVEIKSVIDVGVADGTPELYAAFPHHNFLLIEANPEYADTLSRLARTLPAKVEKVFCGATSGTTPFHLYKSGRKASAYLSGSKEIQKNFIQTITIPVEPLDTLVKKNALPGPYLLKIDVEGAEMDVLKGAAETLHNSSAVILEASVVKRYEGAAQFADLVLYMKEKGFSVYDIIEGAIEDGRLLMVDLVFVKTDAPFRDL